MNEIKPVLAIALLMILAFVAPPADAQNGLNSGSHESVRTNSSSKTPMERGDSTLDSPSFESNMELDPHYDKSGLNQHYDKSGIDENYDKSGFDQQYDKSGLDEHYYKSESIK